MANTVTVRDSNGNTVGSFSTIQAAINAASPFDTVVIGAGTYNENVNVNVNGLTIENAPGAQVTILGQGGFAGALTIANGVFGVTVKSSDGVPGHFVLEGSQTTGQVAALYLVGNNDNIKINGITTVAPATGSGGLNSVLTGGSLNNILFTNNVFSGNADQLVYVNGAEDLGPSAQNGNVNFVGNTFSGSAPGGLLGMSAPGEVINNNFTGSGPVAIGLNESGVNVSGNTFTSLPTEGYFFGDGSYDPKTIENNNTFPQQDEVYIVRNGVRQDGLFTNIQDAINAAVAGDTVFVGNGTYNQNIALANGVNVQGQSEAGVIINGTISTPENFDNTTVSNLTVNDNSSTAMLLDMTGTQEVTSSTFSNVSFNLNSDSTATILIGNGQISGSIALQGNGLTFSGVTMNSNDHNFANSTSFAYTLFHSVNGAQLTLDGVSLNGTASGSTTGLGAQWNMSPNSGETADVTIKNSSTSGGGNFYVSGMASATIENNTFNGQGLALNGVSSASVTGNTFENIDGSITSNGTQHRGLTIENAWGATGDSNLTIENNTFNNITATDGAIAFQRWTDNNGNLIPATISTLNNVDIQGNTFTNLGAGVNPFYLNSGSFGSGAVLPGSISGSQLLLGTSGNDSAAVTATGSIQIFGDAGIDTVSGSPSYGAGYSLSTQNGHWVVSNGTNTDILSGVEKVTINGTTYDLVDHFGSNVGGFQSIQAAINASSTGDTVVIAGGSYTENVNVTTNNLTIENLSGQAVTITGTGGFGGAITIASGVNGTTIQSSDATPANFLLKGAATGELAALYIAGHNSNTTIEGITATGSTIGAGGGHNTVVTGGSLNNLTFENNVFNGNLGSNSQLVYINGAEDLGPSAQNGNVNFIGNTFSGSSPSLLGMSAPGEVINNTFSGATEVAVGLNEPGVTVTGNTFSPASTSLPTIGYFFGDGSYDPKTIEADNTFPQQDEVYVVHNGVRQDGVYSSIQQAIDFASAGDTIVAGPGTYDEQLNINKSITIEGANFGVSGTGTRGNETDIVGGVTISADNVTINGVQVTGSYDSVTQDGTDLPNGIVVKSNNVTIEDSLFTGEGATVDSRPFSTFGGITGFSFNNNAVTGWQEGAYIVNGGSGTISDDTFTNDGNGVVTESVNMVISNDSFQHSGTPAYTIGSDIATDGNQSNIDLKNFIGPSDTFSAGDATQLSVYLNATGPVTLTQDTGINARVHGEFATGPLTYIGGTASDNITGTSLNDTFNVGSGNDTIDGGAGINTVKYDAALTAADITVVGGQWQVTDGSHGTDTLNNIASVTDGTHNFLLVGDGGYATIQAAIDAASAGDTIMIAPGTYVGATVSKALTIIGSGSGQTIVNSGFATDGFDITGNINGSGSATVSIENIGFVDNQTGINVSSTTQLTTLNIDGSDFETNKTNGVGMGSGAPNLGNVNITNSTFTRNGDGTFNGDGDISLFGFVGNALLRNLTINGGTNTIPTTANADFAIQINGRDPTTYDVTHPIGNVTLNNVQVNGSYDKVSVYVQGYTDLNGLDFISTAINGHDGWGYGLYLDPTAGESPTATPGVPGEPGFFDNGHAVAESVNLSGVQVTNGTNSFAGVPLGVVFNGTPQNDTISGLSGNNNFVNGADGIDTVKFTESLTPGNFSFNNTLGDWVVSTTSEGTDILNSVEVVDAGGGKTFLMVGGGSAYASIADAMSSAQFTTGDEIIAQRGTQTLTISGNVHGSNTWVGAANASAVPFTITGLDPDTNGTLTFTDSNNKSVVYQVVNGQVENSSNQVVTSVDLSSLADGAITSTLSTTNSAGGSENATGNAVILDQSPSASIAITGGLSNNTPVESTQLTAAVSFGGPSGDGAASGITYTWLANGTMVLQTGSSATYTPVKGDEGKTITVQASFTDFGGDSETVTSAVTNAVLEAPPTVTPTFANVVANSNQTFAASSLFSAADPDGTSILQYEVEDLNASANSGFWVLNGAVLPANQTVTLSASQLSQLSFMAGSDANSQVADTLKVAASDAGGFGAFATFTVTARTHGPTAAPTVTATNKQETPLSNIAASSLFSATASGGNSIVSYEVEDTTANSGNWIFNGVTEPASQLVDVTAAQLSQLSFQAGFGTDTLMVRANDGNQWSSFATFTISPAPNAGPPTGTSAVMVLEQPSTGVYEIYDVGKNAVLAAYPLTQAGSPWQAVDVGHFDGSDTSDLLLRNGSTGAFELFDVSGNNASGPVQLGSVGTDWSVLGFGDFSGNAGETDMLMRQSGTSKLEAYDISNNQITGSAAMGAVGSEWTFLGVGDFSGNPNETDMLMRDSNNGALEVYNINHNAIAGATPMGAIGAEWSFVGVGDFSGNAGETDLLMRDSNNGALEVYNVHNDQIVSAKSMGAIGLEWSPVGIGDFSGNPGETDMLMRDANNGAFEIYDINNDSVVSASSIGAVGTDWQSVGIAPYQSAGSVIAASEGSVSTGGDGNAMPSGSSAASDSASLWSGVSAVDGGAAQWLPQMQNMAGSMTGFSSSIPAGGAIEDPASMVAATLQQQHQA